MVIDGTPPITPHFQSRSIGTYTEKEHDISQNEVVYENVFVSPHKRQLYATRPGHTSLTLFSHPLLMVLCIYIK